MRSSGGTNLGLALSVVAFTKSMIACFAGPSFHEGKTLASVCADEATGKTRASSNSSAAKVESTMRRLIPARESVVMMIPSNAVFQSS